MLWRQGCAGFPGRPFGGGLTIWRIIALVLLMAAASVTRAQQIGVQRQIFAGISGSSLHSLTNNGDFIANNPSPTLLLTNLFESPTDYSENFGERLRGWIIPPVSGLYVFWLAADDQALLYLSSDASAQNKRPIAINTNSMPERAWYGWASQQSTNIYLEANRRYYIEVLHSAGTGDDALAVGWKLPDGTFEQPIPATRLRAYAQPRTSPPVITVNPTNVTVVENASATFRVEVSNQDVLTYQWQRNGTNLPGAIFSSYTIPTATLADNSASFRCLVSNTSTVNSTTVFLSVTTDTTAPSLQSAANMDLAVVEVMFSEPVDAVTGTNTGNYVLTQSGAPVSVLSAAFGPTPRYIQLTTAGLMMGSNYVLTVTGVRDRAAASNLIPGSPQATFTAMTKGIYREIFTGIPGSYISDLTNNPAFPNNPSIAELLPVCFETPGRIFNNYGQRLRARIVAPITGTYRFSIAADDSATLFLGTNANANSARVIASVSPDVSVAYRQWNIQASQTSQAISLIAGQQYYIEALMQSALYVGYPPDHLAVRWQLPDGTFEEPIADARLTPVGMNPPMISAHPTNVFTIEGRTVSFRVAVSNLDVVTYQWQQNSVDIPGATNSVHVESVELADHLTTFRCVVANPAGTTISSNATMNVAADFTRPTLANAYNLGSNRIVVFFSEPIDPNTATNASNYTLNAGGIGITASAFRDDRSVTLSTGTLMTNGLQYTLRVSNVRDRATTPNTILPSSPWLFVASDFFPQQIGTSSAPASVTLLGNGVNITASGGDLKGTNDQFHYSYQVRRFGFDVKVRVQRLDYADPWSSAGLMARESLSSTSVWAGVFTTPSISGTFFQSRTNAGGIPFSMGNFPANHPHTWLRLQRDAVQNRFTGYASADGETWTKLGSVVLPNWGANVFVGFAVTSHDPTKSVVAQFRDFGENTSLAEGEPSLKREPIGPSSRRTGLSFSEIMYHPAPRGDGRSLEFLELFNSNPFPEDIGGYRISGDVDYVFPPGTILQGGAFLVVARVPADVTAVYGINNVTGPYANNLPNDSGVVRLRNKRDAVLLEVEYGSKTPWPVAPDGSGHSLVLARPSWGEMSVKAWDQSDAIGGSPGRVDGLRGDVLQHVVINEFLAHTDLPDVDYIELYNRSSQTIDLSGCWLSDNPETNKFLIPLGTTIGPTSFVYFAEGVLGFSLASDGEGVYFFNSNRTYIVDSVRFEGQENGVSTGRHPDGAPSWHRLANKSAGGRNGAARNDPVVINEIMYNPITDNDDDEFVELHNRSGLPVNVSGWSLTDGIDFVIPSNTVIAASGYLVVAKNPSRMATNYAGLSNLVGPYSGTLKNAGERIELSMPDTAITTNGVGVVQTNLFYIPVDDVLYGTAGRGERWGRWNDGGGSSLELIDPRADNRLPSNWADSDDTGKTTFTNVVISNLAMDNVPKADSDWNAFQIYLLDEGEAIVDSVTLSIAGATMTGNLIRNSNFDTSLTNWQVQGNHKFSRYEPSGGLGFSGGALRVSATGRGDTGANRVHTVLTGMYNTNQTATLNARVRWLHGTPELLFRVRGNHFEVPVYMPVPKNLGTPGARNSRYITNAAPAITEVMHAPVIPTNNQPVVVTARVHDPDGLSLLQVVYRNDSSFGAPTAVTMLDNGAGGDAVPGDGLYAATIPGHPADVMVAFYVQATDAHATLSRTGRFPSDAPVRECLVRFGETEVLSSFGTYRFWIKEESFNGWLTKERLSNEPNEGTFVYGNFRAMYNGGAYYATSPFHADDLSNSPFSDNADYQFVLPEDEPFLNTTEMRVQMPGNFGRDPTCQGEQTAYWMAEQLGEPALYRRSINLYMNGVRRGIIFEDTTKPNKSFEETWFPDSVLGDMYKIMYWFEFDDSAENQSSIAPASLRNFTTTGGAKKLARYRQTFGKRAVKNSANDYSNLYTLVDTVNTTATGDDYLTEVLPLVDVAQWARVFALERVLNNSDLYGNQKNSGNPGGQNAFLFKPDNDTWKFIIWDIDFAFSGLPTSDLFNFTDPPISNMFSHPFTLRMYYQALEEIADGPFNPANVFPRIDGKYAAYQASGIEAAAPDRIKTFISIRKEYIQWLLTQVGAPFNITANSGNNFTNGSTLVTLTGTAPISARTITINGIPYPLSWTSISNWVVQLPLTSSTNVFTLEGRDENGNVLSNATRSITVFYNGPVGRPEENIVINEVMYRPGVSNASYVEIYNRSTNTTFGLFNYRLRGVDFDFEPATLLPPGSFLTVAKDRFAFQAAYPGVPVAGEFSGNLDPEGEVLTLVRLPQNTNDTEIVIDKVRYSAFSPWPLRPGISNSATALQLIDAAQDNARVSNWDDGSGWHFFSYTGRPSSTRLYFFLSGAGTVYIDDVMLVPGTVPGVGQNHIVNGSFETPFASDNWRLASSGASGSSPTNAFARSGTNCLRLVFTGAGSTGGSHLYQDVTSVSTSSDYTLSFWYRPVTNGNTLSARVGTSTSAGNLAASFSTQPVVATPGTNNWVAGAIDPYPLLWINEVQPVNLSGLLDNTGTNHQPWVELYNSGPSNINLGGLYLAKVHSNLTAHLPSHNPQVAWAFPSNATIAPGEFRVFFLDAQPELTVGTFLHSSFRLDPTNGTIVLARGGQILDYVNYTNLGPNVSYGSWPDGQLFDRQLFYFATPRAANNPAPVPVVINEWMADNKVVMQNPYNNLYDDWFELYNFGDSAVDLSGYFLTDNLGDHNKSRIPNGVIIQPHSFLLVWADSNTSGTNLVGNAVHAAFSLGRGGEELGLYTPEGILVDGLAFGAQDPNVSHGRFPDGNVAGVVYFMAQPTPRTNNLVTNNIYAPALEAIADVTVAEGDTLLFSAVATDADLPVQTLSYSLLPGAPEGASIDANSGEFSWTPSELQGPASYPVTVRVSDNGDPEMEDTKTFTITVDEVNVAPVVNSIADRTVDPGQLVSASISATDADLPAQTLSYALVSGPAGASVNASSGLFTWTPTQGGTTNTIFVRASDDGMPSMSATQSFVVVVNAVSLCQGVKGDVAPRATAGNNTNTIGDWVQIGRFIAGFDPFINACESNKVDCFPIPCGDGTNKISDWVQAGRYAAGLDRWVYFSHPPAPGATPCSGCIVPCSYNFQTNTLPAPALALAASPAEAPLPRNISVIGTYMAPGGTNCIKVVLQAEGDEAGVGFSLNFETEYLSLIAARRYPGALLNTNEASQGRLAFAMAFASPEERLPAGEVVLAEFCFRAAEVEEDVSTAVTFADAPVSRELVAVINEEPVTIPAHYENGTVTITRSVAFEPNFVVGGGDVTLRLTGPPGIFEIEASSDLTNWQRIATVTNTTGVMEYRDSVPQNTTQRFYRALKP